MAKTRTPRKPATKKQTKVEGPRNVLTNPKPLHELLGIVDPYDPHPSRSRRRAT